jgi:hypothetical protein
MTTHTPGPWTIKKASYGALRVGPAILDAPNREAVAYANKSGVDLLARRKADAALIRAAPGMQEGLREILEWIRKARHDWGPHPDDVFDEVERISQLHLAMSEDTYMGRAP